MTPEARAVRISLGYQLAMLVLCLYALGVLAAQTVLHLDPRTRAIFDQADYVVCVLFMADFVVSLSRAPNRWRYFTTWGWIDLLSSIPTISPARWGRAARVLRVLRVLRGLRATKILTTLVLKRRAENTVLAASLIVLLLVAFSSPRAASSSPVTLSEADASRAKGLDVRLHSTRAGVGLFGTLSGFLAAWFLGSDKQKQDPELAAIREELAALRATLERMEMKPAVRRSELGALVQGEVPR